MQEITQTVAKIQVRGDGGLLIANSKDHSFIRLTSFVEYLLCVRHCANNCNLPKVNYSQVNDIRLSIQITAIPSTK